MSQKFDWPLIGKSGGAAIFSLWAGKVFQENLALAPVAIGAVITIFSILAGFLITTMTLIVEPVLQRSRNWRSRQLMLNTVRTCLSRYKFLFSLYLVTLGLAFVLLLVPPEESEVFLYLRWFFLSLTIFAFLVSFTLPGALTKIQMDRYHADLDQVTPKVLKDLESDKKSKK